ncbi:hypothetical protein [Geofilum rhodophaeum]|uniref:hypothetical protein n=1 Tax=Geofilum rhodophaeum TaxID=1965019 RepID=UPI000B526905|nr:hypothetical protein [Geofilum rhodophaeum]
MKTPKAKIDLSDILSKQEAGAVLASAIIKERIAFEKELCRLSVLTGQNFNNSQEIEDFIKEVRVISVTKGFYPDKSAIVSILCHYIANGLTLKQSMDRYIAYRIF